MYLLIDECCSDGLRTVAEKLGHTVQLTREIAALGRGQGDSVIFDFAREHRAVVVTVNAADFRDLARYREHPGIILVPSVREPEQSRLFRHLLATAEHLLAPGSSTFIEVDAKGVIRSFRLPGAPVTAQGSRKHPR